MSSIVTRSAEHETCGFQDVRPESLTLPASGVGESRFRIEEDHGPATTAEIARTSKSRRTPTVRRDRTHLPCRSPITGRPAIASGLAGDRHYRGAPNSRTMNIIDYACNQIPYQPR